MFWKIVLAPIIAFAAVGAVIFYGLPTLTAPDQKRTRQRGRRRNEPVNLPVVAAEQKRTRQEERKRNELGNLPLEEEGIQVIPCTRGFHDDHAHSPDVFSMKKSLRGDVMILCNSAFQNSHEMPGYEIDKKRLEILWRQLHFRVSVETNLTASEMNTTLEAFVDFRLYDIEAIVIVILSHGGRDQNGEFVIGTDEKVVYTRQIEELFHTYRAPTLRNIPKLLIVQACRGVRENRTTIAGQVPSNARYRKGLSLCDQDMDLKLPDCMNLRTVWACLPGYVSYTNQENGSTFFTTMINIFCKHACSKSLSELLIMVSAQMCSPKKDVSQTPSYGTYGWTKKLYFFPGWKCD